VHDPESSSNRAEALFNLAHAVNLFADDDSEEAVALYEVCASSLRQFRPSDGLIVDVYEELGDVYEHLHRHEDSFAMRRASYDAKAVLFAMEAHMVFHPAWMFANALIEYKRYKEAQIFLREALVFAASGDSTYGMLDLHILLAEAIYKYDHVSTNDMILIESLFSHVDKILETADDREQNEKQKKSLDRSRRQMKRILDARDRADAGYAAACAGAVAACARDATAGATCMICLEDTSEGLVRGCGCGFAHLSCLVRHARMATEATDHIDQEDKAEVVRWMQCPLCRADQRGYVSLALAWKYRRSRMVGEDDDDYNIDGRMARIAIGAAWFNTGAIEEAIPLLSDGIDGLINYHGYEPSHTAFAFGRRYLVRCYDALGWEDDAQELRNDMEEDAADERRRIARLTEVPPSEHGGDADTVS